MDVMYRVELYDAADDLQDVWDEYNSQAKGVTAAKNFLVDHDGFYAIVKKIEETDCVRVTVKKTTTTRFSVTKED